MTPKLQQDRSSLVRLPGPVLRSHSTINLLRRFLSMKERTQTLDVDTFLCDVSTSKGEQRNKEEVC
jgi:hypothetical protein